MRQRVSELDQRVARLVEASPTAHTRTLTLEAVDAKRMRLANVLAQKIAESKALLDALIDLTVQDLADLYKISDDENAIISLAPDLQGSDVIVCFEKEEAPQAPAEEPPEE